VLLTGRIGPFSDGAVLAGTCRMAPAHKRPSHVLEVLIGRSAALCLHPIAAWRSRSRNDRALLIASYFAISYVIVFGLLHALAA
jgi:hypothetical protein